METRAKTIVTSWNTTRYELLNARICDLGLKIEGTPLESMVRRVCRELERKGLEYKPVFYLTDTWGCPDEVPAVGIPFYLADRRLIRIEEEQTEAVEDAATALMYLRHEVGHAVNYAYRLWKEKEWTETFGHFTAPYRDVRRPDPHSRDFVSHLVHSSYGRYYAQKHPDEDFAETFAVWLTPRSNWRRRYRDWPVALQKLQYVARAMRRVRHQPPRPAAGKLLNRVEDMPVLLAEHYGQRAERYRAQAEGYVDDKLRRLFPADHGRDLVPAAAFIQRHRPDMTDSVIRWSGLRAADAQTIMDKLQDRAAALGLKVPRRYTAARLIDVTSLATSLAMDFAYTGRFTG